MTEAVKRMKSQADALSADERADLASYLLESFEVEDDSDEEWERELDRRVAEIRSGQAVGYPVEEVLAELREQYP